MTLHEQLRAARHAAHLTQREVAERANISRENYARIERGAASTTLKTMNDICAALGKTLTLAEVAETPAEPYQQFIN